MTRKSSKFLTLPFRSISLRLPTILHKMRNSSHFGNAILKHGSPSYKSCFWASVICNCMRTVDSSTTLTVDGYFQQLHIKIVSLIDSTVYFLFFGETCYSFFVFSNMEMLLRCMLPTRKTPPIVCIVQTDSLNILASKRRE